eukprot:scaffold7613_cov258-Pinguiococcus_pyrenoidosus.AAC.8
MLSSSWTAGSLIVKVGMDAVNAAVIDVFFDREGSARANCTFMPLVGLEGRGGAGEKTGPSACQEFVSRQQSLLGTLLDCELCRLPKAMSTVRVRYEPSELVSFLLSKAKASLEAAGVEIAMVNAGCVRARRDYEEGPFTLDNLMNELTFETPMVVVQLPGAVIADSAFRSRSAPEKETRGFTKRKICFICSSSLSSPRPATAQGPLPPWVSARSGWQSRE